MPNYGDYRLNIPPDWSRKRLANRDFANFLVAHDNGVADAHLTKEPEKIHTFAWVDPTCKDPDYLTGYSEDGFRLITKDEWTITRWQWNAEGYCASQGQLLMAITKEAYEQVLAERQPITMNPNPLGGIEALAEVSDASVEDETHLMTRRNVRRGRPPMTT